METITEKTMRALILLGLLCNVGAWVGTRKPYSALSYYPGRIDDAEAIFYMNITENEYVCVKFINLFMDGDATKCPNSVLKIFHTEIGNWTNPIQFCGKTRPQPFFSRSNKTLGFAWQIGHERNKPVFLFDFMSKIYTCNETIHGNSGTIESIYYPSRYPSDNHCIRKIITNGDHIRIKIPSIDIENSGDCKNNHLKIYTANNSRIICESSPMDSFILNSNTLHYEFKSSDKSTGHGFYGYFESDACGGTLTEPNGTITSPFYPEFYNYTRTCEWKIVNDENRHILVEFEEFIMSTNDPLDGNYVKIMGSTESSDIFVGDDLTGVIVSKSNTLDVVFRSSNKIPITLFKINYRTVDLCKDNTNRTITSPNYPQFYPKQDCKWIVEEYDASKMLKITLVSFYVGVRNNLNKSDKRKSIRCPSDKLKIYGYKICRTKGCEEPLELCGRYKRNTPIYLNVTNVKLEFESKSGGLYPGFELRYDYVEREPNLTSNPVLCTSDKIQSPNFPETYSEIYCEWNLTAPDSAVTAVKIVFESFDVGSEASGYCLNDIVTIKDLTEDTERELCGKYNPNKEIYINATLLKLTFLSRTSDMHSGFKLNYEWIRVNDSTAIQDNPLTCLDVKCRYCDEITSNKFYQDSCNNLILYHDTPYMNYNRFYHCSYLNESLNNKCMNMKMIENFCINSSAKVVRVGKITQDCRICYYNNCRD